MHVRSLLIAVLLVGCLPQPSPLTVKQLTYHAEQCWGEETPYGGMFVYRYGETSECPVQTWFDDEWELFQKRLKIDDDTALADLTILYYTDASPCAPQRIGTAKPIGCYKDVGGAPYAFVDQSTTIATIDFVPPRIYQRPTWPATTFHEIAHYLMDHYGHDPAHAGQLQILRDQRGVAAGVTFEYTDRDRYFYQKVAKALGEEIPSIRYPLSEWDPVRGRRLKKTESNTDWDAIEKAIEQAARETTEELLR